MITINREGVNYSENKIDSLLNFNEPQVWLVSSGTGSAIIDSSLNFAGDSCLKLTSSDPLKLISFTNSAQKTITGTTGNFGFSFYLRKSAALYEINGSVLIYKNNVLIDTQAFSLGNTASELDVNNKWQRYVSSISYDFNFDDSIAFSFQIDADASTSLAEVNLYVDGLMLYQKERQQEAPPKYNFKELNENSLFSIDNVVFVKTASDFGAIDSNKQYFLEGNIDMGTTSIDLSGGKDISIRGADFNVSGLFSTEDNYTLFTGADAGNVNMFDIGIDISGANSKVYALTGNTGFEAVEVTRVNYNNCTSLGYLDTYRQGLEIGTGRFGGTPSLEFIGNWVGGFRITTSIVRNIDDTMADALFKAGTGLVFNSRFLTDINADLGTLAPLLDFSDANFSMFNSLQLIDAIITRNGVIDANDTTIYPNITEKSSYSKWKTNVGLPNTYVGGSLGLTTETATAISLVDTFTPLLGTYTANDLQHFDSPANGQLRNISGSPIDFKIITYIVLQGSANNNITIRLRKFDSSNSTTSTIVSQQATINNFQGGADRCTFSILGRTTLEVNDYYFIEVANNSGTSNVTSLIGSFTTIEERS